MSRTFCEYLREDVPFDNRQDFWKYSTAFSYLEYRQSSEGTQVRIDQKYLSFLKTREV